MRAIREEDRRRILRVVEDDILALVVIEIPGGTYEVIYSDGGYQDFAPRYRGQDFFQAWKEQGLPLLAPEDRERMGQEISRDILIRRLDQEGAFSTLCRFLIDGRAAWCRIKAARDVVEPGTLVLSIRNIDELVLQEQRQNRELSRLQENMDLLRAESPAPAPAAFSFQHPQFHPGTGPARTELRRGPVV